MSDDLVRRGRADLHIHTVASDGTATVEAILDHVERDTDLDVIAITDHERIDAAVAARAMAGNDNPIWPHRDDRNWPHPMVVISSLWRLPSSLD